MTKHPCAGLTHSAMDFEAYVAEIQKFAVSCGVVEDGEMYCDAEAWREAFDEGMTPAEAWQEECYAAAEMLG